MVGSCHMCGKCCEAIHLNLSPEEVKERADMSRNEGKDDTNSDPIFVEQNWTPITKEEAFKINPHFGIMEKRGVNYDDLSFYTCQHYDGKTKSCTIHEIRPNVCSGYPWYGREPHTGDPFYTMDCGYKVDVENWDWEEREEKINDD